MEYNEACRQLMVLKQRYQQCFGPLTFCETSGYPWQWIEEPLAVADILLRKGEKGNVDL